MLELLGKFRVERKMLMKMRQPTKVKEKNMRHKSETRVRSNVRFKPDENRLTFYCMFTTNGKSSTTLLT